MNCRKGCVRAFISFVVVGLAGCSNGLYLTGPGHPYEWQAVPANANCPKLGIWPRVQKTFPYIVCSNMNELNSYESSYYKDCPPTNGGSAGVNADTQLESCRRKYRDLWVEIMMRDIDVLWWGYKNGFMTNDDTVKMAAGTTAIGVAAASAGISSKTWKTGLAILAATASGFDSSFDKSVLENQMAPVLFASIEAEREKIDTQIVTGLKQDTTQYSLAMASRDVMRYANAGSLANALATISTQTGAAVGAASTARDAASSSALAAPTSVSATASGHDVIVGFTPPADTSADPITQYMLIAKPTSGGSVPAPFMESGNNQTKQLKISIPAVGSYTITIWAINNAGPGAQSVPSSQVTISS